MKKISNLFFTIFILAILIMGFCRTVFVPKEINLYENRPANQMPAFTLEDCLEGTYQEGVENALNDQVNGAQTMKKAYHSLTRKVLLGELSGILSHAQNQYVGYGRMQIFDGNYITYAPKELSTISRDLDKRAEAMNELFKKLPDVEFSCFFVEKDTELNLETNENTGTCSYFLDQLSLDDAHKGSFSLNNAEDYKSLFFRTDHHWNYLGSYEGYCQALALVSDEVPLEPAGSATLDTSLSGAKAFIVGAGDLFTEPFTYYTFPLPPLTTTVNGVPSDGYGSADKFISGTTDKVLSYGAFYGGDCGELILDTGNTKKENLLVIGDSFDNAILKLLASHFNITYSLDPRYYEPWTEGTFSLGAYLRSHNISKVLMIGGVEYYMMDTFLPEE